MMRFSFVTRVMMTLALACIGLFGAGVSGVSAQSTAAQGDTYVSELSDLEVAVAGDFVIDETELQEYEHGEGELVYIDGPTAFLQVSFFDDTDEPAETVELFNEGFASEMDTFDVVATEEDVDRVWSFAITTLDGDEFLQYVEVIPDVVGNVDVMTMLAGPTDSFFEDLEAAQTDVTIDEEGIFADVDITDLEMALDEGGSVVTEDDATAVADDAGEDTADADDEDDRRSGAKLPGDTAAGTTDNQSETGRGGKSADAIDFEEAGLVSDNEYTSPQYNIDVEWGEQWFVDMEDEESVTTDPAGGTDSLVLVWNGDDFALFFIDISTADDVVPADLVDYWVSDEYLAESADPNAEILLDDSGRSNGAVLMRDYLSEGDEVIILKEAMLLGDGETMAVVTLIATPTLYADIYADAEADVVIDGGAAVSVFTQRQIERALDQ